MQNTTGQRLVLPPPEFTTKRVAGQEIVVPNHYWLRQFFNSVQGWIDRPEALFHGPDVASASTITISYPFHVVTGSATISTITEIDTFAGGIMFIQNGGSWKLTTGGNIATSLTPLANAVVMLVYDPVTRLWYVPEGLAIGETIIGGTPNDVVFVDSSGNVGQDNNFTWISASGLHLKKDLSMESGANVTLDSGSVTVTAGNITVTAGNLTVTSGNETITAGSLTLGAGPLVVTAGSLTLGAGALIMGAGSKITQYNGIATVGNGVPALYATVDLTGQTAAIAATTIYTTVGAGLFRISYVAKVTTPGGISSVLGGTNGFQVAYTDADDSIVITTAASLTSNLNTTQSQVNGSIVVNAKAATAIQYLFDYTSAGTAMVYALHLKVEAL